MKTFRCEWATSRIVPLVAFLEKTQFIHIGGRAWRVHSSFSGPNKSAIENRIMRIDPKACRIEIHEENVEKSLDLVDVR